MCRGRCFCYMLKFVHSTARTLCVLEQNLLDFVEFSYVKTLYYIANKHKFWNTSIL